MTGYPDTPSMSDNPGTPLPQWWCVEGSGMCIICGTEHTVEEDCRMGDGPHPVTGVLNLEP